MWVRQNGDAEQKSLLSEWPVDRPRNWVQAVNAAWSVKERESLQTCIARNRPYGSDEWQTKTAAKLGLMHTLRSAGRPKKERDKRGRTRN